MKKLSQGACVYLLMSLIPMVAYGTIIVEPAQPTTADTIQITVSGVFGNPCFEVSSSNSITGNEITVPVEIIAANVPCLQVVAPWTVTEEIGQLPVGQYQVTATVSCSLCLPPACKGCCSRETS